MWLRFFREHEDRLKEVYPGLGPERFLMEVRDLIEKKAHTVHVDLESADHSFSDSLRKDLEHSFLEGIPFQYLLGKSEFYHHDFFVTPSVLIPRQETEFLVDIIVNEFKGKTKKVLDVGTGSGIILLSLLSHDVGESGVGTDISEAALEIATVNTKRLKLEKKVTLIKSDRLKEVEGTFDLIVSNPPYIKAQSHRHLVHESVNKFEPHEALYLPDQEYKAWFQEFFQGIKSHLKGTFFMEGHELELDEQAHMLKELGFMNVQVLNDLTGSKRFLRAELLS